jgi:hypothetical protein
MLPIIPIVVIVLDVIALAVFIYTWVTSENKTRKLKYLNSIVIVLLVANMISAACQFFVTGLSEKECRLLHEVSGTCYAIVIGLARVFFACRLAMVSPKSHTLFTQCLVSASIVFAIANIILLHVSFETFIDPETDSCVVVLSLSVIFQSVLITLLDLVTVTAFILLLVASANSTSIPSPSSASKPTAAGNSNGI